MVGLKVKGFFDVLCENGEIWDFKTAKADKRGDKLKSLPLGRFNPSKPDSQTMAYLYLRRLRKSETLSLTYHYLKEMIKPNPDPEEVSLTFRPEVLTPSKDLLKALCLQKGGPPCFYAGEIKAAEAALDALDDAKATALCKEILASASLLSEEEVKAGFAKALSKHFKDAEFVDKCVGSIIKSLSDRLLEQDLDAFEKYLLAQQERLERANREGFKRMPADKEVCYDCAYVTLCGERGYRSREGTDTEGDDDGTG